MAAAKKKKKEKSSSPNIALVIFLIFFILVTISMGVLVYYDQETMLKAKQDQAAAKAALTAEKLTMSYYEMLWQEYRIMAGEQLTEDERTALDGYRAEFAKEDYGRFKDQKNKDVYRKNIDELKQILGGGERDKDAKKIFQAEIKLANDKATLLAGQLATAIDQHAKTKKLFDELNGIQDEFNKKAVARSGDENNKIFAATQKNSKSYTDLFETNRKLQADLVEAANKQGDKEEELTKIIAAQQRQIKAMEKAAKEEAGIAVGNAARGGEAVFPLLLDISPGRPLWDHPVGKVMRVDPDLRQIAVNIGAAQGAKTEQTFNIFSPGSNGRALGQLKGSLEIIRVVDSGTSIARLNALYDGEGKEIALNDVSRSRVLRETESPIREGDLLFNLFWGTRVAFAGYVNITGDASDNPAEQIRQMEDFAYLLQRNGMQVDAYIDMRDGKVGGVGIGPKTRYLILGDDLRVAGGAKKKKEGEDPEPAADQPGADRGKLINDAKEALKKTAIANGLLLVSQENFATLIGYRRARSANNPELSAFRPALPFAGEPGQGVIDLRPKDDKKDADMKDKAPAKDKDAN